MDNRPVSLPKRAYVNVMEALVVQEVDRQLKQQPPRVLQYVKRVEVETYALNRLPALYASSEKGLQHQSEYAEHQLRQKIADAVRCAFAAVQVDPLRLVEPLDLVADDESQAVLGALRSLFNTPDLTWAMALEKLKALKRKRQRQEAPTPTTHRQKSWQPATYGSEVAWKPQTPTSGKAFAWEDARYR